MPDETVINGGIVAVDEGADRPSTFRQNCGSSKALVLCYVFDVLVHAGIGKRCRLVRNFLRNEAENRIFCCVIELGWIDLRRPILPIPGDGPLERSFA